MKAWHIVLALILTAGTLIGCAGQESATPVVKSSQEYTSAVLVTSYDGALPAGSQLALGTLRLEETDHAVTPAQARVLLPLWQAIQSGVAQNSAEMNAIFRQIEKAMTPQQLAAIAAMQLTMQDVTDYAQANGLMMGSPSRAMGRGQAGTGPQSGQGWDMPGTMTDEQRQAFRATAEAGGFGGRQGPGNLSEEQRASLRATFEAGGMPASGLRPAGGGSEFLSGLIRPLVDLLTQRAAQ